MAAANSFIGESGIPGLTMRRLGGVLEVEAMSLYRYVPGRENLLDAVVEAIMDEMHDDEEVLASPRDGGDVPSGTVRRRADPDLCRLRKVLMVDGNRPPRPDPLSSIGSWATKTIRVKRPPTTVVEAGDASAALVGLTAVAAAGVLAAVLWRRSHR